jgi:four helix bundle protein
MAKITSFRDLLVWQKSMSLAERSYLMSRRMRRDDQMALGHQIRKSSISIPSNIAEGFGRHHTAQYVNQLWTSNGSNNELQSQLELAHRVRIFSSDEAQTLIADAEEIGRMLGGLIKSLERGTPGR